VTITPAANKPGATPSASPTITIDVFDGLATTSMSFLLTVNAVKFIKFMDARVNVFFGPFAIFFFIKFIGWVCVIRRVIIKVTGFYNCTMFTCGSMYMRRRCVLMLVCLIEFIGDRNQISVIVLGHITSA